MDILTVVFIFVLIEVGVYGFCCFLCRENHVSGELGEQSKDRVASVQPIASDSPGSRPLSKTSPYTDCRSKKPGKSTSIDHSSSRTSLSGDCE
jgi:hypothetical protein